MRVERYEDHDYRLRFGYEEESYLPHDWVDFCSVEEDEIWIASVTKGKP